MATQENSNWLYDQGFDDIPLNQNTGFSWPVQAFGASNIVGMEADDSFVQPEVPIISASKKRARNEECAPSSAKACREKQRRDRLNDKFLELAALIEPGKAPKADKSAILFDALRMVTQLRGEAQKLNDLNSNLKDKIKELKAEKNELREEKQRLKVEQEKLEHQLKTTNTPPQPGGFLQAHHPQMIPPFAAAQSHGGPPGVNKLVPVIGYPGIAMWQFLPPASIDTSQDHVLRPPVA